MPYNNNKFLHLDAKPNTNVMSITLHSPIETNKKIEIPIAKPRSNTFIPGIKRK